MRVSTLGVGSTESRNMREVLKIRETEVFERRIKMRKGKGELTYKQLIDDNRRLRQENEKLRNDLKSRTIALNKLIASRRENEGVMKK